MIIYTSTNHSIISEQLLHEALLCIPDLMKEKVFWSQAQVSKTLQIMNFRFDMLCDNVSVASKASSGIQL